MHESVDDASRAVRVGLRDIADRTAELAELDTKGAFAELTEHVGKAAENLGQDAILLAQCGGEIAELRGNRAAWRAVRVTDEEGQQ